MFDGVGDVMANNGRSLLSYVKDARHVPALNANQAISGVLCPAGLATMVRPDIIAIVCDDPTYAFFSLVHYFAERVFEGIPSHSQSDYDPAWVSVAPESVFIGRNVVLEPGVVIHKGVRLGDECIIRAGAVLGLDSFQHQRTRHGIISPSHNGFLEIGARVEVGANSTLSKGFSYRPTFVDDDVKCDAHSYVAHGAYIARESFICAGARIMGHTVIGAQSFIGPGAIVSSRVILGPKTDVSLGSVVTKNSPGGGRLRSRADPDARVLPAGRPYV